MKNFTLEINIITKDRSEAEVIQILNHIFDLMEKTHENIKVITMIPVTQLEIKQ